MADRASIPPYRQIVFDDQFDFARLKTLSSFYNMLPEMILSTTVKSKVFKRVYDMKINFFPKGHSK